MINKKILTYSSSILVGIIFAYSSRVYPILPREVFESSFISFWSFFLKNYWWLVLIFFALGYGITYLIFYLIYRRNN